MKETIEGIALHSGNIVLCTAIINRVKQNLTIKELIKLVNSIRKV